MTEAQTSVEISLATTDQQAKIVYAISAKDAEGQPISGTEISINIEGDGSFAPNFHAKELFRTTGDNGVATFTWHRSGIYLRRVKSKINATMAAEGTLELNEIEAEEEGLKISYVDRPIRISPPRV